MDKTLKAALLSAAILLGGVFLHGQDRTTESFRHALDLYNHGMFERAGTIFDRISTETGDVLAEGYKTLCAVNRRSMSCSDSSTSSTKRIMIPW